MTSHLDEERTLTFSLLLLSVNLRQKWGFRLFGYRKWTSAGRVGCTYPLGRANNDDTEVAMGWLTDYERIYAFRSVFGFSAPFSVDATFRKLDEPNLVHSFKRIQDGYILGRNSSSSSKLELLTKTCFRLWRRRDLEYFRLLLAWMTLRLDFVVQHLSCRSFRTNTGLQLDNWCWRWKWSEYRNSETNLWQ